jgi:MATE family multidrug resistance protein
MGAIGTGVATAISQWAMAGLYLFWFAGSRVYRAYGASAIPDRPDGVVIKEILVLGIPMGGTLLAETALFSAAGLMVGAMGANTVAAHQIALNYASFTFMAPVSFHSATTIQVGHALGGRDRAAARIAGFAGISLCGILMATSAILLLLFCDDIARLYSGDPQVQPLASHLLMLAGIFQISDGLQVGAMGALRGFQDARIPLAITLGAYWLIGFPVAYFCGFAAGHGPVGVWWGLIAGLTTAAVLLFTRYERVSRTAEH